MNDNFELAGFQGWKQFLNERKKLLDQYDQAKVLSEGHTVQTHHGIAAEALFRNWLESFLPKRFGVTSGYIIQRRNRDEKTGPHFDVIIFDAINSPTLWIEDTPDSSPQGRRRALPVEHVYGVIEVKARLTKQSATDAVEHLKKLEELVLGIELASKERADRLPTQFTCGVVFFEANEEDLKAEILNELLTSLRGYHGGIILRCNGLDSLYTGELRLSQWKNSDLHHHDSLLYGKGWYESKKVIPFTTETSLSLMCTFAPGYFSQYAFNIMNWMTGSQRDIPYGMIYFRSINPASKLEDSVAPMYL